MPSVSLLTRLFLVAATIENARGNLDWWKHATFYQVYPRSFKDSNNDGIGDLRGIIEKVDHFADAGVDAIWLSPVFKSPQVDQGYDISSYVDIDPDYGTMEDLDDLVEKAHNLGFKVILDFVPNHTSDQHPWFVDSVNGTDEFKDFYVWADPLIDANGTRQPPNNWISVFGNSAWTWSDTRQQYYLHQFSAPQPDLNYRNPAVVAAMTEVLQFWLDRGIDGFRIDAVPHIFETSELLDEPLSKSTDSDPDDYRYLEHIHTKDLPETYNLIYQWRQFVDNYTKERGGSQRVLMTEAYSNIEKTMLYYGTADGTKLGGHFTFNFKLITKLDHNSTATDVVDVINNWLQSIPKMYISNWVIGNHDNHRTATRLGPQNVDGFNMLVAVLPGIAVTYNGEEIGQEDGEVTYEERQDPSARNPTTFKTVGRDFERTPYQWDDSVNAGFNKGGKPWLPVSKKYKQTNLNQQKLTAGNSHYKIYKQLMTLRKQEPLMSGATELEALDDKVIVIKRKNDDAAVVLIFNNGDDKAIIDATKYISDDNSIVLVSTDSNHQIGSSINPAALSVDGHESLLIKT